MGFDGGDCDRSRAKSPVWRVVSAISLLGVEFLRCSSILRDGEKCSRDWDEEDESWTYGKENRR